MKHNTLFDVGGGPDNCNSTICICVLLGENVKKKRDKARSFSINFTINVATGS